MRWTAGVGWVGCAQRAGRVVRSAQCAQVRACRHARWRRGACRALFVCLWPGLLPGGGGEPPLRCHVVAAAARRAERRMGRPANSPALRTALGTACRQDERLGGC